MKNQGAQRLSIKRETLRELNPIDVAFAKGGAISAQGSDVSNCCCQPTSNQTACGGIPR